MIDIKADPLHPMPMPGAAVPVAAGTSILFNGLAVAAGALAALLPIAICLYWSLADREQLLLSLGSGAHGSGNLDSMQRLWAAAVSVLAAMPLSWGLVRLRVCFIEFARGRPFAARGIAGLRDFAAGVGAMVLAKPAGFMALALLMSWNAPAGMRQFVIRIDSDALLLALFAATIGSLAWAMEKAAALAEENSQFV